MTKLTRIALLFLAGLLSAGKDLLVTAVAGTGTATGAITVVAFAIPS